jgi:hypothetical protein
MANFDEFSASKLLCRSMPESGEEKEDDDGITDQRWFAWGNSPIDPVNELYREKDCARRLDYLKCDCLSRTDLADTEISQGTPTARG